MGAANLRKEDDRLMESLAQESGTVFESEDEWRREDDGGKSMSLPLCGYDAPILLER